MKTMRNELFVRHENVRMLPECGTPWAITVGIVNMLTVDIPDVVDVPRADVPHALSSTSRFGKQHRRRAMIAFTPCRNVPFLTFWSEYSPLSNRNNTVRTLS